MVVNRGEYVTLSYRLLLEELNRYAVDFTNLPFFGPTNLSLHLI